MQAYINATVAISPQNTFFENNYLQEKVVHDEEYLICLEPDYKDFIDPKLSRRMARVIKMGVCAAIKSLRNAGVENPDAIIIGTGLGCLKDTEKFLTDIIENNEGVLSPTPFIQSTHNTIGGQIALMLGCNQYNFTYVHRGHSFESALLDGIFKLEEGSSSVLVGGVDESTPATYRILSKMNCVKPASSTRGAKKEGPVLGEGAAFFVLAAKPDRDCYAKISGIRSFYNPESIDEVKDEINHFLDSTGVKPADIGVMVGGMNGSSDEDDFYTQTHETLFPDKPLVSFKSLCGEYQTASAFGLNLAACMIRHQQIYPHTLYSGSPVKDMEHVLLYNHYKKKNHNLILLSKCHPTG